MAIYLGQGDRDKFDLAGSTLFYAREVFEDSCRAAHPTLNGYKLTDDGYKLDFRESNDELGKAELAQDKHFAPLHQGILDSAERFGPAAAILGHSFVDCKPWINYLLVSKLAFPRAEEVDQIRTQKHLDDFHGKNKLTAGFDIARVPLWEKSQMRLRFDPLVRAKCFFHHLQMRINDETCFE